jgi:hypothetical protein
MTINLDRMAKVAERYMLDQVQVLREETDASMVMNPVTLALTVDSTIVYTGKGMVSALGSAGDVTLGGVTPVAKITYEVAIPLAAAEVKPNDVVLVTTARDPQLQGQRLRVVGIMPTTFLVSRRISAVLEVAAQ